MNNRELLLEIALGEMIDLIDEGFLILNPEFAVEDQEHIDEVVNGAVMVLTSEEPEEEE